MAYRRRHRRRSGSYSFRGPKGWLRRANRRHYRGAKRKAKRYARRAYLWAFSD